MKNFKEDMKILFFVILASILIAFIFSKIPAPTKKAQAECRYWQATADEVGIYNPHFHPGGFYLTEWQKKQCDSVGEPVYAPVR